MSHKIPPNRDLVVFTLSMMDSITDRFHTEAIAIRCHELFPTSFSWTTRPDLPDKDVVRVALTDARKEKFGGLVEGRAGQSRGQYQWTRRDPMLDGWRLTEAGFTWIEANRARFDALLQASQDRGVFPPKDHRQKSRKKLKWVLAMPCSQSSGAAEMPSNLASGSWPISRGAGSMQSHLSGVGALRT